MKNELIVGIAGAALVVLAGCVSTTPNLDAKFGNAVNMAKAQQIVNKDGPKNTDPVAGLDGQAANAVIDRYHKSYETPTPAPAGAIGVVVGGGTTLK